MNILLFGQHGQVAWELQRSLQPLGTVVVVSSRHSRHAGDFAVPDGIRQTIRTLRPAVIVNAAAYTAVDKAESEPALARLVNAVTPGVIAEEAQALGALFVHYSTDYVFDGSGSQPRCEDEPCRPINVYGRSKREGEEAILTVGANSVIFRTSWVYAARGSNFLRTLLRLGQERDSLRIVADQIGAPTGAELIADVTAHAILQAQQRDVSGIYHLVPHGETSWFDYARTVFEMIEQRERRFRLSSSAITPITSAEYPLPAPRPLNSRLCNQRLETQFGLRLPHWRTGIERVIEQLLETA